MQVDPEAASAAVSVVSGVDCVKASSTALVQVVLFDSFGNRVAPSGSNSVIYAW